LKVRLLRSVLFQISGDGETNWIEGVQLLSVYLILGILFFYLPSRTSVRTRRIRSRF
jgi:Ca2+:H+ antiporter